jgi:hypothetical protein
MDTGRIDGERAVNRGFLARFVDKNGSETQGNSIRGERRVERVFDLILA